MEVSTKRTPAVAPEVVLAAGLLVLAVALHFLGRHVETDDFRLFLRPWSEFITANGGFSALRFPFSDYHMPYLYVLVGLTWLAEHTPISLLAWIKLFSSVFDAVLAFYVVKLVALRGGDRTLAWLAGIAVLLLPTVVLDAAYWGQCDSLWTAILLAGLYYLLRDRPWLGTVLFGVAFAIKTQAVFLFPVLLLLLLIGRLPWRCLLTVPAVCVLLAVPAVLTGRPVIDLVRTYVDQAGEYPALTMNAPSLYSFVDPAKELETVRSAGILFAAAAFLILIFTLLVRKVTFDDKRIVVFAAVCAIMAPFLLPAMHERYFYLADVLAVVAAFWAPRRLWFVPLLLQAASVLTYSWYIFALRVVVDLRLLTLLPLAALLATAAELLRREPAVVSPPAATPEPLPARPA